MNLDFQQAYWEEKLRYPDWYVRLEDELQQFFFPVVHHNPQLKVFRNRLYDLIAELVTSKKLLLAQDGPNLDSHRQPLQTIVIHHTEEVPEISLGKLSAIGLVRQYAYQYLTNDVLGHRVKGQPIWSGHFRAGSMVFFAYHWLVRPDGTTERLLDDAYIGWHSGNWAVNTRSIAIALSGNYEDSAPSLTQVAAVAQLIKEHYPHIPRQNVLGHREVKADLTCPGAKFLTEWKETLLNEL